MEQRLEKELACYFLTQPSWQQHLQRAHKLDHMHEESTPSQADFPEVHTCMNNVIQSPNITVNNLGISLSLQYCIFVQIDRENLALKKRITEVNRNSSEYILIVL